MSEEVVTFSNIVLGGRGVSAQGTLKLHDGGIAWKKSQGSTTQAIKKAEIVGLLWTVVPGGGQLRVRQQDKHTVLFNGFAKPDAERIQEYAQREFGVQLERQSCATAGHNWGRLSVHGASIAFQSLDGKHVMELPLHEVGEVQGQKEDAILEFHVDDTAISDREDALCSVTFVIPDESTDFAVDEEGTTPADAFKAAIVDKTDALAGSLDEAIASLDQVSALVPRGRYDVKFHPAFMDLDGQNHQYKIRYTSMHRLYTLPRPAPAGNLVIIALDPPIRRGQTFYPQVVCFFDAHEEVSLELDATPEFIERKNADNRANLEATMSGRADNVFTRLLRGLSGAKVTKTGSFRAADGGSSFLQCSYKNESGTLYPLERSFFYVLKPTLLIPYEDVESVEFERQFGVHSVSVRTFDLAINMRATEPGGKEVQHLFRNIQKQEWTPLLNFIEEKKIRIENFEAARAGPLSGPALPLGSGDVDPGLARMGVDEDEEDDDFAGGSDDDESDGEFAASGSDSDSESGDSDAELVAEEGITAEAVGGGKRKRSSSGGGDAGRSSSGGGGADDPLIRPKKKAGRPPKAETKGGRKKKDKNAPKRNMSAFMCFSNAKREEVKAANPGIAFTEIPKRLGEMWKELSADDKVPYEEMAAKDKERYQAAMKEYSAKKAADADGSGGEDDNDDDEGGDE